MAIGDGHSINLWSTTTGSSTDAKIDSFGPGGCIVGWPEGDAVELRIPCETHFMGDEVELADGKICGRCAWCGQAIFGRRLPGGLGLARLKNALADALGDRDALPDLLEEIDRVRLMLEVEEQSIEEANNLIKVAKRMMSVLLESNSDE